VVQALSGLGSVLREQGDIQQARALLEEGLALAYDLRYKTYIQVLLNRLGEVARQEQDYLQAIIYYRQSLQLCYELGDKESASVVLHNLGHAELYQHQVAQAAAHFAECLAIGQALGYKRSIADALAALGAVAAQRQPQAAARLLGATAALRGNIGYQFDSVDQNAYDDHLAVVRAQLDPVTFEAAWAAGQGMGLEEAIAEAEAVAQAAQAAPEPQTPLSAPQHPAGLTEREVEVLRLVAQGLTNLQIAEQLIISPRTVHAHLRAIYGKIEVTTRSAATRFALEHNLA
jgi:DNA-binding CsgD family transcriptional regulator